ncbi:MAG: prephenate dehydrogenase/arogenate dehydrogenase family protein [Betaproteobacteria bacterium]|nr:prephenate dehydrogenase/arogenate dehydrogenase family protein [Betaproteobacteria bacterium]
MSVAATPRPVPAAGKLVVVGVGLIGGSFALALKAAAEVGEVVGVGRGRANLDDALRLGIVDRAVTLADDWTRELAAADVVLIAAPVAQYPALLRAMAGRLGPATLVTDAGSTKQDVIAAARDALGADFPRFVPAHPIAGTEHSGAAAAFPALYRDRNVVLTPLADTDPDAVRRVGALWTACGARLRTLAPAAHDRVFAAVSHLPHLLAFALVDAFAARPDREEIFRFAASGFRDFTRIAASSPEMWRDIAVANRGALLAEIAAFRAQLDRVTAMLETGDAAALAAVFAHARAARRAWEAAQGPAAAVAAEGPRDSAVGE